MKKLLTITSLVILTLSFSPTPISHAQTSEVEKQCGEYPTKEINFNQIRCYANYGENKCSDIKKSKEYKAEEETLTKLPNSTPEETKIKEQKLKSLNEKYTDLINNCNDLVKQQQIIKDKPTYNKLAPNNSCLTSNLNSTALESIMDCKYTQRTKNLDTLYQALQNNYIYQIIEEPIGTENLLTRQTTCTYKYLKDKNGFYQVIEKNTSADKTSNEYFQKNKFSIIADTCYESFVDQCTPSPVQSNKVSILNDKNQIIPLPVSVTCKTVQLVYGSSGTDFVKRYVGLIYRFAVGIVGVIAVLIIVVSGIQISVAGDDSSKVTEAKERITQSLVGLAILFLAGLILRSVNPNFFTTQDLEINNPSQQTQTTNSVTPNQ